MANRFSWWVRRWLKRRILKVVILHDALQRLPQMQQQIDQQGAAMLEMDSRITAALADIDQQTNELAEQVTVVADATANIAGDLAALEARVEGNETRPSAEEIAAAIRGSRSKLAVAVDGLKAAAVALQAVAASEPRPDGQSSEVGGAVGETGEGDVVVVEDAAGAQSDVEVAPAIVE